MDAYGRLAEPILVDRDHLLVPEKAELKIIQRGEIATQDERRRIEHPRRHVRDLLVRRQLVGAAARGRVELRAESERVQIVPCTRTDVGPPVFLKRIVGQEGVHRTLIRRLNASQ